MKQNDRNFAVFILTHGRADNILTLNTLRKLGYTGKIYFIVDDMDSQLPRYKELYGDDVIVFSKQEAKAECDTMDNLDGMNIVLFARNSCHRIAKELGLTHFLELDDDYTTFGFRYIKGDSLSHKTCHNLDKLFEAYLDCLDVSGAKTIALAQGGDFIGGINGHYLERVLRKSMNSFFCRTDRPFKFYGRINEDTNCYVYNGSRGELYFTTSEASLEQIQTQKNSGGLTEAYLDLGTYKKSFYSVMIMPSAVKISAMGNKNYRIHHAVSWNNCVPKIISDKYRRA